MILLAGTYYTTFLEFSILMKLLIKMCSNCTNSNIYIGNYLSDAFHIQNGLKLGGALSPLLFNFALEYAIRKVQKNQIGIRIDWDTSASGVC
jgi:hypothetical protein